MVEQVSVFLQNEPGRLARLARSLGDAGINMHALMVADTSDFGVVRIICDNPAKAESVLESEGFGASVTPVVAVVMPDRPGGLADVLDALGEAGMNVEYAYCFVENKFSAAVDVFKVDDAGAEAVLLKAGLRVLQPADLYASDAD